MTELQTFGLTYLPRHSRRLLNMDSKGAIDRVAFDELILSEIIMQELGAWVDVIPDKKLRRICLYNRDKVLPTMVINDFWKVRQFITKHGPSAIVGIAQAEALIWMRRLGLTDGYEYAETVRRLDAAPMKDFKEMILCEA